MTFRPQQLIAGLALGGAVATATAIMVPQLFAAQAVPAVAEARTESVAEPAPIDSVVSDNAAIDMNHWQETAAPPPSPFIPGKDRKK